MSSPTVEQKILAELSLFSNLVCVAPPDTNPAALLFDAISAALKDHETEIGKWEIVWGPAVETTGTLFLPVNSMYAVRSLDQPSRYVVAIAGTNPLSLFDWFVEDFLIAIQVPWDFAAGAGSISLGTAIGLSILLQSAPTGNRPSAGRGLFDFLLALPDTKIDLTFTGHSLGGALAPVLALALHDVQSSWDPAKRARLHVATTGAPTPGNREFAAYVDHHLAVTRFWNSLDIVPHAWKQTSLDELPQLFAPEIPEDLAIDVLVGMAKAHALAGDYEQIRPHAVPFAGTVNTGFINPRESTLFNYLLQALYQHVVAYFDYFGIQGEEAGRISQAFIDTPMVHSMLPLLARRARIPISRGIRKFARRSLRIARIEPEIVLQDVRATFRSFIQRCELIRKI